MGLQEWALASRIRYALVWGGLPLVFWLGLGVVFGSWSIRRALWIAIPWGLLVLFTHALIWYPRARRKATTRPG